MSLSLWFLPLLNSSLITLSSIFNFERIWIYLAGFFFPTLSQRSEYFISNERSTNFCKSFREWGIKKQFSYVSPTVFPNSKTLPEHPVGVWLHGAKFRSAAQDSSPVMYRQGWTNHLEQDGLASPFVFRSQSNFITLKNSLKICLLPFAFTRYT